MYWRYLQIRDCIIKGNFMSGNNTVMFLELPSIAHRASIFYKSLNVLQTDICNNLRIIWQRDLGCDITLVKKDLYPVISNSIPIYGSVTYA